MTSSYRPNLTVRPMRSEDVQETFNIINAEHWNLTLRKLSLLYQRFPDGFFVAATDENEIVGTMSMFPTFENELVIGNIVVKEAFRRMGLGRKIVKESLTYYPDKIISLQAVPGVGLFYQNIGFTLSEPQQTHTVIHMTVEEEEMERRMNSIADNVKDNIVTSLDASDMDQLLAYDTETRGYDCSMFISVLVECSTVLKAVDTKTNKIVGYASVIFNNDEILLDGLYADSDHIAFILFRNAMNLFPGETKFKLQIHQSQTFLKNLGRATKVEDYSRYAIGTPHRLQERKVYCVSDGDYTC